MFVDIYVSIMLTLLAFIGLNISQIEYIQFKKSLLFIKVLTSPVKKGSSKFQPKWGVIENFNLKRSSSKIFKKILLSFPGEGVT